MSILLFFIFTIKCPSEIISYNSDGAIKYIDDYYEIETPDTFFERFNNQKLKEFCKYSDYLLEYLIKLLERYIYLDILKNPPKSESYYHTKYDLLNVNNYPNCSDYYNFYGSIKKWLSQAEDAHLSLFLNYKMIIHILKKN